MKRVILETPYKGKDYESTEENLRFARLCGHDCIIRGEAYFASHLLYTQEGVLDDKIPQERKLGIEAGFAWKEIADKTVVYINRGISKGMNLGIHKAVELGQEFEYRTLAGYDKNTASPKIVTISGSTGCGKTTVARQILKFSPSAKMVTSYTTRGPRSSDLLGEYRYNIDPEYFHKHADEFLWVIPVHDQIYGTTRASVTEALNSVGPSLMLLAPPVIPLLRTAVKKLTDSEESVRSFYILSPGEEELGRRLALREDDPLATQKRIAASKKAEEWDKLALESTVPYIFLTNNEPMVGPRKAAQKILSLL